VCLWFRYESKIDTISSRTFATISWLDEILTMAAITKTQRNRNFQTKFVLKLCLSCSFGMNGVLHVMPKKICIRAKFYETSNMKNRLQKTTTQNSTKLQVW